MIHGIGIDSVEIDRFADWHTFCPERLQRIFSNEEIEYCLKLLPKASERFAIRFAAREAFFKALQAANHDTPLSFLAICRAVSITRNDQGLPQLAIDWKRIKASSGSAKPLNTHLSLTHSRTMATAIVILES